MDFKHAITLFSDWRLANGKDTQLVRGYDREIRNFAVFTRKAKVEDVGVQDVTDYMNGIKEYGWSTNSCIPKGSALRRFFHFLELQDLGIKTLNPKLIPVPDKKYHFPRVADEEAYKKLLSVIPQDSNDPRHIRNLVFINLLWDTGARNGEILSINIGDLDLDRMAVAIKTEKSKGKKPFRNIFWNEETNKNLKRWLESREKMISKMELADPYALFISVCTVKSGQRFTIKGSGEMLRRYSNKAGLPYTINAHSFRHHKGHDIVNNGGSANDVMNILGHSSVDSGTVYTRMHGRELEERYRRLTTPLPINKDENEEDEQQREFNPGEIMLRSIPHPQFRDKIEKVREVSI